MKKILLSVLMMSLCGSVFAAPEGFDYSVLDKIKIDCSRYNTIDDDHIQLPNGKTMEMPKEFIAEFQAKMRFQSTLDVNKDSLPKKVFEVMYIFPNNVSDKANSHCGKSLSEYMKYNKKDLLSFAKMFYPDDDIHNTFLIEFFK